MNKLRRFLPIILAVVLTIALSVGVVYGFLTDKQNKVNEIGYGEDEITITETFPPAPSPQPGDVITKNVKITSTGDLDAYVRIRVLFSPESMLENVTIDYNTTDWTYNTDDGMWYYNRVLPKGQSTSSLFTSITVKSDVPAEDIVPFDVIVNAESTQAGGFDNMWDAWAVWNND